VVRQEVWERVCEGKVEVVRLEEVGFLLGGGCRVRRLGESSRHKGTGWGWPETGHVHKDGQSDCGKDSIMYIRPLSGKTEMLLMSRYMYGLSNSVRVGAF
jgi:hypothetical protein